MRIPDAVQIVRNGEEADADAAESRRVFKILVKEIDKYVNGLCDLFDSMNRLHNHTHSTNTKLDNEVATEFGKEGERIAKVKAALAALKAANNM
jgi:hypothetical protein